MQSEQNFADYKQLYINLPNYGQEKIKWGQDFPVLVERIKATIDEVPGVDRRILISHDWGCHYGYMVDQVGGLLLRNILTSLAGLSQWTCQRMQKFQDFLVNCWCCSTSRF